MLLRAVVVLVALMSARHAAAQAAPPVQNVLLLQSFDRGNRSLDQFTSYLRVDLGKRTGRPINVIEIIVGPTATLRASEQAVVDYIRATFANRPAPDLIVSAGGPAATFARTYRQQLFPATPLLFGSVDERWLRDKPLEDNEVSVAVTNDFALTVETMLRLLPDTRQVFVVIGNGQLAGFWRRELETVQFKRFQGRLVFSWANGMTLPEILQRGASLPEHSTIFYVNLFMDSQGGAYPDERVIAELHAEANAPIFAAHDVYFGLGTVGGSMLSVEQSARNAADAAIRILDGAKPSSIHVPVQHAAPPIFDVRELERWSIPESRLPPGSVVQFRPPGLWQTHGRAVRASIAVLLVQSLLILGLLYQRRARRRAESESRKNLALAVDASRRQTMAALTSSIAHELGQPLGSIMSNAEALSIMVGTDRAPPETIKEIVSDMQSQGARATQIVERHRTMLNTHQLKKQQIDLGNVVTETLALVGHDMRRREIEAVVNPAPETCTINGDQVLLQQVLVNLLMNAMDAMTDVPHTERRITISSGVSAQTVQLAVRDTGTGLPAELDQRLFAPFVSTKSHGMGIGLTIVQTIVNAHDGTIAARNNPGGGATFTLTFPRA